MHAKDDAWFDQLAPGRSRIPERQFAPNADWVKQPALVEMETCPAPSPSPGKCELLKVPNCVALALAVNCNATHWLAPTLKRSTSLNDGHVLPRVLFHWLVDPLADGGVQLPPPPPPPLVTVRDVC